MPQCAATLQPLEELLVQAKCQDSTISCPDAAVAAFAAVKNALADTALLECQEHVAFASLMTDASEVTLGAELQQLRGGIWLPIDFFSKKSSPAEKKYSTFGRDLFRLTSQWGSSVTS